MAESRRSSLSKSALEALGKKDPKQVTSEEWKKVLSPLEYSVAREGDTERPFSGKFEKHFEPGLYVCRCCGAQLFKSESKFNSGCGWPAFSKSVDNDLNIVRLKDTSMGMNRVEVRCKQCSAHLGHVFNDGPKETGERYCINSCCMDFEK
uniref:Peptide-methionine (R)-S-oxide reductase n=1 Tax=Setaria digitata TaxID=48799 RepID=A0A915Q194_9BILA